MLLYSTCGDDTLSLVVVVAAAATAAVAAAVYESLRACLHVCFQLAASLSNKAGRGALCSVSVLMLSWAPWSAVHSPHCRSRLCLVAQSMVVPDSVWLRRQCFCRRLWFVMHVHDAR